MSELMMPRIEQLEAENKTLKKEVQDLRAQLTVARQTRDYYEEMLVRMVEKHEHDEEIVGKRPDFDFRVKSQGGG